MYHIGYVAYFQLNIDQIIDKYCVNVEAPQLECNGKCHLAKQLSVVSDLDNDTTDYTFLVEAFFPLYFQNSEYKTSVNYLFSTIKHKWYYYRNDISCYVFDCFQPPQRVA